MEIKKNYYKTNLEQHSYLLNFYIPNYNIIWNSIKHKIILNIRIKEPILFDYAILYSYFVSKSSKVSIY